MNRSLCCFAAVAFVIAAMPLAGQQEVPMQTIVEDRRLPADIDAQPVVQAAAALRPALRHYQDEIEREQRLSRSRIRRLAEAGNLVVVPSLSSLQRPVRDGMRLVLDRV